MIKKHIYKILISYLTLLSLLIVNIKPSENIKTNKSMKYYSNKEKSTLEFIESNDELKIYFNDNITFNDLKESLMENKNINSEYQKYTEEFINLLSSQYPTLNLISLNENLKNFQVIEKSKNELQNENKNRQAYYDVMKTTIYMHNEYINEEIKKYCYFHELWHMVNNIYIKKDGIIFYKNTTLFVNNSVPLDEGMTTFLTEQIYKVQGLNSYPKQYDVIKILYEIYGNNLLENYFNLGVEGIKNLIKENTDFTTASILLKLMNKEKNGDLDEPLAIYEILFQLCNETTNYTAISEILKNIYYESEEKEEILNYFYNTIYSFNFNEYTQVTFDNEKFYNINELYYIEIANNGNYYLVNDEILIEYFKSSYIRNIYDQDGIYIDKSQVFFRNTLEESIKLEKIDFEFDEYNNFIIINPEKIRGVSYVKSK